VTRTCESCGDSLEGLRTDARACSDVCRKRAERVTKATEAGELAAMDTETAGYDALLTAVIAEQAALDATDTDVTSASFDYGDLPTGLLLWSDWHVGSRWTNHAQLREDVAFVGQYRQANPNALRLAHLGDIVDNYFPAGPHPTGMAESVIARTDKQRGLALLLAKIAGQFDAMLYGCHLAWNVTKTGDDVLAPMAKELGAVNGGYGLAMTINVGSQTYRGLIRHKTVGMGSQNPGNAGRRTDDMYGPEGQRADFISMSHQHTCHMETYEKAGRHVVFTRSGGYKGGDCFARAGAYTHTKPADMGVPLLIFMPDTHKIIPFEGHSWREGLAFLRQLRREYRKRAMEVAA
jgi:hypothetical protein